jgi:hypothetical protein
MSHNLYCRQYSYSGDGVGYLPPSFHYQLDLNELILIHGRCYYLYPALVMWSTDLFLHLVRILGLSYRQNSQSWVFRTVPKPPASVEVITPNFMHLTTPSLRHNLYRQHLGQTGSPTVLTGTL